MSRRLAWLIFIVYMALLTKLILFKTQLGSVHYPHGYSKYFSIKQNLVRVNVIPFKTIIGLLSEHMSPFIFQNIVGNVVGFIPIGIMLPILYPALASLKRAVALSAAISLTYELIQLVAVLGYCDIDDIILNTFGGAIGFLVYKMYFYYSKASSA